MSMHVRDNRADPLRSPWLADGNRKTSWPRYSWSATSFASSSTRSAQILVPPVSTSGWRLLKVKHQRHRRLLRQRRIPQARRKTVRRPRHTMRCDTTVSTSTYSSRELRPRKRHLCRRESKTCTVPQPWSPAPCRVPPPMAAALRPKGRCDSRSRGDLPLPPLPALEANRRHHGLRN